MSFKISVSILFFVCMIVFGLETTQAQECERLYSKGLNTQCRAVQTPIVSSVSLEAVAVTFENEPDKDYCRLDFQVNGDMSEFKQAIDSGTVKLIRGPNLAYGNPRNPQNISARIYEWNEQGLRATFSAQSSGRQYTYARLNRYGLSEHLNVLKKAVYLRIDLREGDKEYTLLSSIQTPREAFNLPAMYLKCQNDIRLAREGVKRRELVIQRQVAIEFARQTALAEIEFLNNEIAFVEEAILEMQTSIVAAEEAIEEALAKRRTLLLIEEQFGTILNAFWTNLNLRHDTFYEWADERLESIDTLLTDAEAHKTAIEKLEKRFQAGFKLNCLAQSKRQEKRRRT